MTSKEQLLYRYAERQGVPKWGKDYQPAIRATPQEAPAISRPTILQSAKLGREVHLLSTPETHAALFALFHPALIDLHEQRVLSPAPALHPLQGHRVSIGLTLPNVLGTVKAADQLGALSRHPKVMLVLREGPTWVPVPYVGDLLLFLTDANGPYCVNWTVKLTEADFSRRPPSRGRLRLLDPHPASEIRHQIEAVHYLAAVIRTHRVTSVDFDVELIANLRVLFGWHDRPSVASDEQRMHAVEIFREGIGGAKTVYKLAQEAAEAVNLPQYEAMVIFYQALWQRVLVVDLFRPVLADRPLRVEEEDPFQRYAAWFER
jgi:hypothetical protein